MPLTRDASRVMLNSCRVCSTRIREFTREWSFKSAMSSYICAVIGHSARSAIQWCSRWSLQAERQQESAHVTKGHVNSNKGKYNTPFSGFTFPLVYNIAVCSCKHSAKLQSRRVSISPPENSKSQQTQRSPNVSIWFPFGYFFRTK